MKEKERLHQLDMAYILAWAYNNNIHIYNIYIYIIILYIYINMLNWLPQFVDKMAIIAKSTGNHGI